MTFKSGMKRKSHSQIGLTKRSEKTVSDECSIQYNSPSVKPMPNNLFEANGRNIMFIPLMHVVVENRFAISIGRPLLLSRENAAIDMTPALRRNGALL
mmetsp:Transcript_6823/g.13317  ORF Transcript_6823/g.13317 Transcript_6823/m.13317 type:complete len:98 (-) Transcript_6823:909-1202(-)